MKKITLYILLGLSWIWGCENNQVFDCTEEPIVVAFETILSDSVTQGCKLQNIDDNELIVNLIIKSQDEYENYVGCIGELPVVDFSEKTLLAGRMMAPKEDKVIKQSVSKDCNEIYLYTVEIGYGIAAHPISVYYHALIPKTPANAKIEFDIKYLK